MAQAVGYTKRFLNPSISTMATTVVSEINLRLPMPGAEPRTVMLRSEDARLVPAPEAAVAATLLPAMQAGKDLHLDEPLDPAFAENLSTIQDIYATWYGDAQHVAVHAPDCTPTPASSTGRTATFFSGGVDSFYTLLKNEAEIDALVYVHGFDVDLENTQLRQQVSDMLREVGAHFGKDVIEVETNLRDFSNPVVSWPRYYGSALVSIAHCLESNVDKIFIPAAQTYKDLFPEGAHPLLDPLWSGRTLAFAHDGCEATRVDKTRRLSESDVALTNLRVCWRNPGGAYNCGRCEKCQRTMINLLAVDALQDCPAFDGELDVEKVAELKLDSKPKKALMLQNLSALERSGIALEVQQAIRKALQPPLAYRIADLLHKRYWAARHRLGNILRSWGLR